MSETVEIARDVIEQLDRAIWIAKFHGRSEAVIFGLAKAALEQCVAALSPTHPDQTPAP